MATDNLTQSGASTAADSAREETVTLGSSTGPAGEAVEPAALDPNATAPDAPQQATEGEASGAQDFSALLETYEKESAASRQEGEIVRGAVVGVSEQNVLVDIGYQSEGVVAHEEFLDRHGNLTVKRGDPVDVLIKSLENQDGYAVLSRAAAMQVQSWGRLRHALRARATI